MHILLLVPFQGLARASPSPGLPGWTGNPSGANDSPSTWQNRQGPVMTIFRFPNSVSFPYSKGKYLVI